MGLEKDFLVKKPLQVVRVAQVVLAMSQPVSVALGLVMGLGLEHPAKKQLQVVKVAQVVLAIYCPKITSQTS